MREVFVSLLEKTHLKESVKSVIKSARQFRVPKKSVVIRRVLSHDPGAFTQGLAILGETLYESTGLQEKSSLREIDLRTGEIKTIIPVENMWAEGIGILNDKIVQLTWKSKIAIIYSIECLRVVGRFRYDGEGWGLTALQNQFAMTDGSNTIYLRDSNFQIDRSIRVYLNVFPVHRLNDITYAEGKLYACVLNDSNIYEICGKSGTVTAIVDCSPLIEHAKPGRSEDVLNGVCYDDRSRSFYVTGKRWRHLFNIEIVPA